MSNNRLYLIDTETDDKILLAKSFGNWVITYNLSELNDWLKNRDLASAISSKYKTKLKIESE